MPSTVLPTFRRVLDGNSRVHLVDQFPSVTGEPAHTMGFSSDGELVAVGDDAGLLEIRQHNPTCQLWERVRLFGKLGKIRALQWHKKEGRTVFVGSEKGFIFKVTVSKDPKGEDTILRADVKGFVHALALSDEGKLAAEIGEKVVIYDKPFATGKEIGLGNSLDLRSFQGVTSKNLLEVPRIRNLHFITSIS
ncbi:hypothetical protein NLJ89_g11172 [Agrocybe chaxingu]|uniref:Uncharacterized protein n=1 Tax=Agrocybe chaxingu TaxID=84603 RepID=A0A9W8MPL3_9AGAR|nr:hypothetical protein NLJ89_g11172 [Agrocybe chaxingu]